MLNLFVEYKPFSDLFIVETLEEVKMKNMQILMFKGWASNAYFSTAKSGIPKELWERTLKNRPSAYIYNNDYQAAIEKLRESKNNILFLPSFAFSSIEVAAGRMACQVCFCSPRFFNFGI